MNNLEIDYLTEYDKQDYDKNYDVQRVNAVNDLNLYYTLPEEKFDKIRNLASKIFNVPVVLITLVAEKRAWFKSSIGFSLNEIERKDSICTLAIKRDELFLVTNAQEDYRVANLKYVCNEPHIKFYAGFPIHNKNYRVGTLCIVDYIEKDLSDYDKEILKSLASLVDNEIVLLNKNTEINNKNILLEKDKIFKNSMMSIINHDIVNELSPAVSLLPIFKNNPDLNMFRLISNAINNTKEYANSILDIYKYELNLNILNKTNTTINNILSKINTDKLTFYKYNENYDIFCDEYKIIRVLNNLINNSVKFIPKIDGIITLKISKTKENKILFKLRDNGPGVPENKIKDLFKLVSLEYFDENNPLSNGIGLYSCYIIVKEHNGDIWYEQPKINKKLGACVCAGAGAGAGACFKFYI